MVPYFLQRVAIKNVTVCNQAWYLLYTRKRTMLSSILVNLAMWYGVWWKGEHSL